MYLRIYLDVSQYDENLFYLNLFHVLTSAFFAKYFRTLRLRKRSLYAFYAISLY